MRYGELALRGKNRGEYEKLLALNIKRMLADFEKVSITRMRGRLIIHCSGEVSEAMDRVCDAFGVHSVSPCFSVPAKIEAIRAEAVRLMGEELSERSSDGSGVTFRIQTRRAEKVFPMNSSEINRDVGSAVLDVYPGLKVKLKNPEIMVEVEVRTSIAHLYTKRLPGPLGLPVTSAGKVVSLLSGGIDSPVASYLAMKRGCEVVLINYHSYPFIGEASKEKVIALARRLVKYQPRIRLHIIPFAEIQKEVKRTAFESYRTVLYRRAMQKIAGRIASIEGALALVTGDCLGQVASQSLENLHCIGSATKYQVLRPLVSYDKTEVIDIARRIGTFDTSILPEPDCCTVFQPRRPVIRGVVAKAEELEANFDLDRLIQEAVEQREIVRLDCQGRESRRMADKS